MAVAGKPHGTAGAGQVPGAALALAGVALASIWVCVAVADAYAPDVVSGSQHEHLALVPWTNWVWALAATSFVVLAALQGVRARVVAVAPWVGLAVGVAAVWVLVAVVSAFAPVFVTGTDPTIIPMAALGVPIVGAFLTWFVCTFVKAQFEPYAA